MRYRGYVYDWETGLYYLQSRYYNPEWGRFINADAYAATGQGFVGNNMFAYCLNSVIGLSDHLGTYSRDAAVDYAEKWYDDKNKDYYYYNRGDCANFVSQCLRAGGIVDSTNWYHNRTKITFLEFIRHPFQNPLYLLSYKYRYNWSSSESWRLADEQYRYFSNPSNGYINGEVVTISSKSQIANIANNGGVQPGDLLYFSSNGTSVHHATIISKVENGEIFYAAHSDPRFDRPLGDAIGTETIFIVRIFDDAQ